MDAPSPFGPGFGHDRPLPWGLPRPLRPDELEELVQWDELPVARRDALTADLVGGRAVALLERAETWLRTTLDATCPASELLYDYATGPGARSFGAGLSAEEHAEVADHVAHCRACADFCKTLDSVPPPPLEIDEPSAAGPFALEPLWSEEPAEADLPPAAVPIHSMRWLPVAAAALVLVGGLGLSRRWMAGGAEGAWPVAPLLRQGTADALLFPRGLVLLEGPANTDGKLAFEATEVPGARSYRVAVTHHDGSAFAGDAREVAVFESPTLPVVGDLRLEVGHYTWSLTAEVGGLTTPPVERDFEVRQASAPLVLDGTVATIRRLDEAGFQTDARALAKRQPESAARDRYLELHGR